MKLQDLPGLRINLFVIARADQRPAALDAQVTALRGKREEVDLLSVRISAATYRGRMKEAATLLDEWVARMDAASRRPQTGPAHRLPGDRRSHRRVERGATTRIAASVEDERIGDALVDDRLVVAALTGDAATARALLPAAVEQQKQTSGADAAAGQRAMGALAMIAARRPAEAIDLLEPVSFESRNSELVAMWSIAHVLAGNWETAIKGLTFMAVGAGAARLQRLKTVRDGAAWPRLRSRPAARTRPARRTRQFFDHWKDADPDRAAAREGPRGVRQAGLVGAGLQSQPSQRIFAGAFCPSGINVTYF